MRDERLALRKTKQLIVDWANLPDPVSENWAGMLKNHPDTFVRFASNQVLLSEVIERVRHFLREAWIATDMHSRDWWLFTARLEYSHASFKTIPEEFQRVVRMFAGAAESVPLDDALRHLTAGVPPPSAFDRVVEYAKRMSVCEGTNCEDPLFLRGEKRERYCSHCKAAARLRSKKKYWDTKGRYNRKPKQSLR